MTVLAQISASQSQKEVTANQNLEAVASAAFFSRRAAGVSGLTWGFYGGYYDLDGVITLQADGTIALPASQTLLTQYHRRSAVSKVITGVTAANPCVITSTAHGLNPGDVVYITGVVGMTQLNGAFALVIAAAANTLTLHFSSAAFTAYTSGGTLFQCATGTTLQAGFTYTAFTPGGYIGHEVITGASTITSYLDFRRNYERPLPEALSKSVAGSANVVLTRNESSVPVLTLTGLLSGNISVTFPLRVGAWLVNNITTGAFTITVKNPNSVGVVLMQGKAAYLFSNGASYLGPVTQVSDGVAAHADQAAVTLGNTNAEIGGLTISGAYSQAEVQALRDKAEELADDVRALSLLIHAMRTVLVANGSMKGAS